MKARGKVSFPSLRDAVFHGYDACGLCQRKHNHVVQYGLLDLDRDTDTETTGELVVPDMRVAFAATLVNGRNYHVVLAVGETRKELTLAPEATELMMKMDGSDQSFSAAERTLLTKLLYALQQEFSARNEAFPAQVALLMRFGFVLLAQPDTEPIRHRSRAMPVGKAPPVSRAPATREPYVFTPQGALADLVYTKDGDEFLTLDAFLEDLDESDFVQERRPPLPIELPPFWAAVFDTEGELPFSGPVYKGEAVQCHWTDGSGVHRKAWGIIAGKHGDGYLGCGGTRDVFDPVLSEDVPSSWIIDLLRNMDVLNGWAYHFADHDMCTVEENDCFGPCADEFWEAVPEFLLAAFLVPSQANIYDGNNPPSELKITQAELQRGYYSFAEAGHPMAGRKIGTPLGWTANLTKRRWEGTPQQLPLGPPVTDIYASPNPFSPDTGTNIYFRLEKESRVSVRLYKNTESYPFKELCTGETFPAGENPIYWDGTNSWELGADPDVYDVEFLVDGVSVKKENVVRKQLLSTHQPLPPAELLSDVDIQPQAFSSAHPLKISFSLREPARVSIYIYHQRWRCYPRNIVAKIIEDKHLSQGRVATPYTWNGGNKHGRKATNGLYKVRFLVNGQESIFSGYRKVR